jgi:beta-lactamase class D
MNPKELGENTPHYIGENISTKPNVWIENLLFPSPWKQNGVFRLWLRRTFHKSQSGFDFSSTKNRR